MCRCSIVNRDGETPRPRPRKRPVDNLADKHSYRTFIEFLRQHRTSRVTKKCPHQLALHAGLHLRQRRAPVTASTAVEPAIPTATGPERARAHALRTDRTDPDQTVIAMAKETASAQSADTETLPNSQWFSLIRRASCPGATSRPTNPCSLCTWISRKGNSSKI